MVRDKVVYAFLREDDTPFYIGMGSVDRARNHKKGSRNYRWWEEMKSNPNYKFIIVDRSLSKQEAWDIEVDLIKKFGRQHIDDGGILTNIHPGGSFWGEAVKKPVIQFTLSGNRIAKFDSISEAVKFMNKDYDIVTATCKGYQKSGYGFRWFYESEVGDTDYIGPVKRIGKSGGHDTTRKYYFDLTNMIPFSSQQKAMEYRDLWYSGFNWRKIKSEFNIITKEEHYYLQELIKL